MQTDDGFLHAWTIRAEIPEDAWQLLRGDVIRVIRASSAALERHRRDEQLAVLRGPEGFGPLRLAPEQLAFNGNAFLGQAGDPFSLERVASQGVIARVGKAGTRRAVRRCDTRGYPYDLAVCASLLVVLRHLPDTMRIGTTGRLKSGWASAASVVRGALGAECQLIQTERGMLRWIDASPRVWREREHSSA